MAVDICDLTTYELFRVTNGRLYAVMNGVVYHDMILLAATITYHYEQAGLRPPDCVSLFELALSSDLTMLHRQKHPWETRDQANDGR
ncbi:hypothetical protein [Beijerinckia sp. L45]|uniref:hypothetical protein n=1 Tax=Beijerinckia sp. L45 TaxID=1641855 RepID=UPI00131E976D|nr:hypothetical protein [Beijerinckia sp. L45]